jgi:flagellar basal-body rod modification protein FlgD
MKNQDPTQPTDPNAYIQQLVGVNSLQQLISINQELGGLGSTSTGTTATGASIVSQVGDS